MPLSCKWIECMIHTFIKCLSAQWKAFSYHIHKGNEICRGNYFWSYSCIDEKKKSKRWLLIYLKSEAQEYKDFTGEVFDLAVMYASAWFSHDTAGLWCRLCSYTPWTLCYIANNFCQLAEFHNLDVSHVHVSFWQWYIQYFLGSNVLNFTTDPCELTQIKKSWMLC